MARPQATPRALAVARGDEPADTLITGGRVFADATREWIDTSLALADGVIAGWGARDAHEVIDVSGAALTPGFIDAHMHLESTKLWIDEFVATVLPAGTTAVAADPHELANVLGVPGILALIAAAAPLPFTFGVYASSCVPASPFESAGAALDAADIRELIDRHGARGVAEVMNFPGVIAGDPEMLARVAVAGRLRVDGHIPGVSGRRLDAYLAAGIESDHESTMLAEAEEKRRKGMWVFLREGSASQNLVALAPTIVAHGSAQAAFCTDDREPDTLRRRGHINDCARLAVASGISEIDAVLLASTNPARYHGFAALGSLGPGHQADVLAFSSLGSWQPERVWQRGGLVVDAGELVPGAVPPSPAPDVLRDTINIGPLPGADALVVPAHRGAYVRAVGVDSHSLTTRHVELEVEPDADLAHAAVVERHRATGRVGRGFVTGFGLRQGAIASTVAHDAHNVVVVGASGEPRSRCHWRG
jgi:adenine deaminase